MMRCNSMNIEQYLDADGFNIQRNSVQCKLDEAEWCAYRRVRVSTKECLCNGKAPQLAIIHHSSYLNGKTHKSYTIELVQESDLGWCNLSFYGLSEQEVIFNLSKYESALVKAWESCWLEGSAG